MQEVEHLTNISRIKLFWLEGVELINFVENSKVSGTNKRKEAKINALISDLVSGNELKISTALKALQSNGDASILPHMVEVLRRTDSEKIHAEICEFLNDLKDTSAIPVIIDLLREENDSEMRKILLTSIWSSKLDYSSYLADFVAIAAEGDFMEAIECITVIENLDGPIEERHILESQLHLKDYLEDSAPKDTQKAQIMSEIAILIKEMNESEDDGIAYFNE